MTAMFSPSHRICWRKCSGCTEPTITNVARALQRDGLIECRRGQVRILNRDGLIGASCECYQVVRARIAHHLPRPTRMTLFGNIDYRRDPSAMAQLSFAPGLCLSSAAGEPIKARELIRNASYGPEQLKVLFTAFDQAWESMAADVGTEPVAVEAAVSSSPMSSCVWATRQKTQIGSRTRPCRSCERRWAARAVSAEPPRRDHAPSSLLAASPGCR